ncbi:hypothetical protein ACTMTJ_20560 [Phytohabitans sp. LJ34]|uniref:hypothetical protein n=1 Tax=Phytohabitans sp. LJ34 TaxID=3452217 RepID=UPI003F8AB14D
MDVRMLADVPAALRDEAWAMYGTSERALYVLDQAAEVLARADVTWRSAIRQALAGGVPIEQVATRANTTIDNVLAIVNTPLTAR